MDFAGGCGGAARWRVRALGACGEEKQRGSERASAPSSAGVGERVGAGRLRRAAASTAHGRHAAGELCRGRDVARRVSGQASAEAGQARRWAGLGQGEARGAARGWLGRLRSWAGNEAAARD